MATLVIVESPTKARTIRGFLPRGYRVEASMGHIRDLPDGAKDVPPKYKGQEWARLGVNVDQDFEPLYVVPAEKKKVVKELKDALKDVDELILATDEDREGESISWHLVEVLSPKVPIKRMVFHEITKEAIRDALDATRVVDDQLVRAQETRRILDRLVGYTLSPLLWKKIAWGLSAGRVQSVAVRLLVQRERERRAFRAGTWWDLKAGLRHEGQAFEAVLTTLNGTRLATGKDFGETSGRLEKPGDVVLLDQARAESLRDRLLTRPWRVASVEEKPQVRRPKPPFTTSTLQQESNRKLRLSARETMRTAQSLYERGFITYMRTDSVHLSNQAVTAARECIERLYGPDYLSPQPRNYSNKGAHTQEAHEAIRPAGSHFRTPEESGLAGIERDLYDLIWKRTVACQMADARMTGVTVILNVEEAQFRASGTRIDFAGFRRAYVEGSDDPEAALEDQEVLLPALAVDDSPTCEKLDAVSHVTQPPARYTEATLVKELEEDGVGRPSTYASVIGTILERGYTVKQGQALVPTFTAIAVTLLLEKHFPHLVDIKFTARMEQSLDDIAEGEAEWLPYLREFYLGDDGLRHQTEVKQDSIDPAEARSITLQGLDATVRIGRFGPYIERQDNGSAIRVSVPESVPPADLDGEIIETLLREKKEGPTSLGEDPATAQPVYIRTGQYGPYVQLGDVTDEQPKPKRMSLPRGVKPEDVTLELALGLLALPRPLGVHPETGAKVLAGLGRFGPYIVHDQGKEGKDYRSIKGEDHVLTITLARALEMLAQPKQGRGRRAEPKPMRELGPHPDDQAVINLYDGRYGPYVKHGDVSASIPRGQDPATVTLAQAVELIAVRAAMGGGKKKKKTKSAPRKASAVAEAVTEPKAAKPKAGKKPRKSKKAEAQT
ncbi:MAG TPA: type I DNA topoisomerase [Gemmatimonadales bacterium]|nr:type I DNA topoisomerase [Gemmatimonadales bacterium]